MAEVSRRGYLTAAGSIGFGALTGCLGQSSNGAPRSDSPSTQTSFVILYDFARHITQEMVTIQNLVPFGQHGHGWEPGPDIQRKIMESAAFIYMGDGFQPWADRIVTNLREGDVDVEIIAGWTDIDLLSMPEPPERATDPRDHSHGDDSHRAGDNYHQEKSDAKDPHFWLDFDRAKQSVDTLTTGLAAVDSDNAPVFRENASIYRERLTGLDEKFVGDLRSRTKDRILFAGHNSFQYLGNRYSFRVESITGTAPDSAPSPRDISRAQTIIREHGIRYVLAPVFESDRLAHQLVRDTTAEAVLPLTPVPSLTDEWRQNDWGFVDVMERVNLPSLRQALGV